MNVDAIPKLAPMEDAAILIWALLHAAGGTMTRMDLARAFALRSKTQTRCGLMDALQALADRSGVTLDVNASGRSIVTVNGHTPASDKIDPWFHREAQRLLRAIADGRVTA